MAKLIGHGRGSTKGQTTDRQVSDLLAVGVRRDDVYVEHGVSGGRSRRPEVDAALDALDALEALEAGDTLVVTTLDRLGRSTANMLDLAGVLRTRGAALRMLHLRGGDVDTSTPMGGMVFTVMAALAEMELAIKRERIVNKHQQASGGRQRSRRSPPTVDRKPNSQCLSPDQRRRIRYAGRARLEHVACHAISQTSTLPEAHNA